MKKRFGKNDVILIGILLAGALLVFGFGNFYQRKTGIMVQIQVDGELYGTYSLQEEQTLPIKTDGKTTNILQIADGKAYMLTADCPDQLCVHQQAVSKEGQTIVCLPNKVVVEVSGTGKGDYDAIAQ